MAGKNTAVFGTYRDRQHAEQGVDALRMAGFRNSDVSALLPDNVGTKDSLMRRIRRRPKVRPPESRPEARWGGWPASARWLFRVWGLFIAADPIMGALAGAGVVGAVGGLAGALVGMGIPEYEAKRYEGPIRRAACCYQWIATIPIG